MKLFDRIIFLYYIFRKFYTKEGKPLKCIHCSSDRIESSGIDTCFGVVTEERYICSDCKRVVAHWILGEYEPCLGKAYSVVSTTAPLKTELKITHNSKDYITLNMNYFQLGFSKQYKWLMIGNNDSNAHMSPSGFPSIENYSKIEDTISDAIKDWERQVAEFDKDKALASIQYMKNNVKEIAAIIKKEMENE